MIEIVEICTERGCMFYIDNVPLYKEPMEISQKECLQKVLSTQTSTTKYEKLRLYEIIKLTEC